MPRRVCRADEADRLAKFFDALQGAIPEPPEGWRERAKPPGSTIKTRGHRSEVLGPYKALT
jgi:hypothetical protein